VQKRLPGYGRPDQERVRSKGAPATTLLPRYPKQHRLVPQGTCGAHTEAGKQKGRRLVWAFSHKEEEPPTISHTDMAKMPQRVGNRMPCNSRGKN